MADDFDPYEFDETEGVMCPRCDGWKEVSCHCGGDLCFCENNGEMDCPLCCGEGTVTEEVYEKYVAREREIMQAFRSALPPERT